MLLGRALEESQWRLITYAIMSNHIHLGVIAGADPLDRWIRRVHSPFADAMNRARDRIGCVFVRGPKALLVDRTDVGNLIAYVHNNPVRAGVVARPGESSWTSHRAYLGRAPCPPWLRTKLGLKMVGIADTRAFDRWVSDPRRRATEQRFTEDAHERELASMKRRAEAAATALRRASSEVVVQATAQLVGISTAQLCSHSRFDVAVLGRTVAVHCALSLGLSATEVARALNLSQQGVSAIQRRAMDHRTTSMVQDAEKRVRSIIRRASGAGLTPNFP